MSAGYCMVCEPPRRFASFEAFDRHYTSSHFETYGTHEDEYEDYLEHLTQEHLEDAK
jgi:hypothetical protein